MSAARKPSPLAQANEEASEVFRLREERKLSFEETVRRVDELRTRNRSMIDWLIG